MFIDCDQFKESKGDTEENDYSKDCYGKLPMLQSQEKLSRELHHVKSLINDLGETKVWVRGRLHTSRAKGNGLYCMIHCFIFKHKNIRFHLALLLYYLMCINLVNQKQT